MSHRFLKEMCGIWCCLGPATPLAAKCVSALSSRGPEGTRVVDMSGCTLGFTRLAINGLNEAGMQPMRRGGISWICNGEIYNWKELASQYGLVNVSGSDCEILGELYEKFCNLGIPLADFFRALDGVFAMIIVDKNRVIVARDPYGVRPLYMALDDDARRFFGSEIKSLIDVGQDIQPVMPGHYMVFENRHMLDYTAYHMAAPVKNPMYSRVDLAATAVRETLTLAVRKRLLTERPVAALLSGGLDSSLVAALVSKELRLAGAPPLETYSIGMQGSQDLYYAKMVANWIGSNHTEVVVSPEEFFAAIPEVIRDIESYDTTTVRASVGNWLLGKTIAAQSQAKVVFNGDGSDEVWGSYLYFFNAPYPHAYEAEVNRLLKDIHLFDVLRSDRCISSHGLEPRTPFLDKAFVAVAQSVATDLRRPSKSGRPEKWLMRMAFDNGLLPKEVLWRKKEAFSDGVSGTDRSWYQIAQDMAETAMIGQEFTDSTAEKGYYRATYRSIYGENAVNVPYFWMPRWSTATDPSARTLTID
jgi:asparagine synthase (glutamine-hydrolysing)